MRKYILAIILMCVGLVLFIYNYSQNNKTKYSETLFNIEAQAFDKSFTSFINSVEQNIKSIQADFRDESKVKDTIYSKNYFLKFMENDTYLISTVFINNAYKIAIRKDEKSLVFAIDSTEKLDVVRWQRYENKKLISSWQESFDQNISKTSWFNDLKNGENKIQWFFKIDDTENEELFYAGFTYPLGNSNNTILMEFSRAKLLENFNSNTQYNQVNLWVASTQKELINLATDRIKNDSLQISTFNHFKQFNQTKDGTFNFKYKNEEYWNSFKKYPTKTGILYYLLTIPNKEIQLNNSNIYPALLKWISIFLIIAGLILLFVKKRFFYKTNRMMIPSAKEILNKDENRYLEFKSSSRWDYRQEKTNPELEKVVLKTLAAFGNTDGGILLIGVDDDKNILGLENDFKTLKKSTADYYEIHLRNLFHNAMGVKYVSKYIRMQFELCENQKVICKIKVLATNEPIYLKFKNKNGQVEEKFFVRSGNSSQEIKSMSEINDYINTRFKK